MTTKKIISIIVPCFNEELNILTTYKELKKVSNSEKKYQFQFIFVDNNSTDKTAKLIKQISQKDKDVLGILLSRNFGPEASAWAGMTYASGDAIVLIECDLQNPPQLIHQFINEWEKDYQVVVGIYDKPVDGPLMTMFRKIFYSIFKKISNIDVPINTTGFGLIDKQVLDALKALPEKYRFYRGLRSWVGFKTTYINYKREKRARGESSYNFFDYIKHAERGVFGFSYLPLDLMIYAGFILVTLSFIFIFLYILLSLLFGNPIKGSITILVSIVFFGGIQVLAISILGKYIQVITEEVKARPVFIVDKIIKKNASK
ncbi:MAG: glycosyltransferase family 2 protein [Candidatus Woesebacteria bacterium]|jgi:dolichol-phosphate mannosyltransferase